jgi:hypothetical protein
LELVRRNVSGSDYIKVTSILILHKDVPPKDISEYLIRYLDGIALSQKASIVYLIRLCTKK